MPSQPSKPRPKPKSSQLSFTAIGTSWLIERYDGRVFTSGIERAIAARIEVFDAQYSRFRPDSLVSMMAKQAGTYAMPTDAKPMLDLYQQLYIQSNGLMTPLIGQSLADIGYDADYSLVPKAIITPPPPWEDVLLYNHPDLTVIRPILLDFGALGKGHLVDIISSLLLEQGITAHCINAGGDMYYRSDTNQALQVGLENPNDTSEAIGVATITNQAICGSAGNRRRWDKYHHILNPKNLQSPEQLAAVWVVAHSCMLADALTTALFFTSPAELHMYHEFEYALLMSDGSLCYSVNFPAKLFEA